ncbi:endonuclease III domain-containing protein [Methanolobus halotolerans]|uniref:Endonuclease n=1 Tax=Methanolobus halotolerans TaxID=2052935 RepID=A0A4E0PUZ2_9EURY|nr:endonuclease [Methanolobus halotolerans]TGC09033.1 endonuclease [Methanolobus halotolerans]
MKDNDILEIYQTLLDEMGLQYWWPADTAFEVVVGAILTQQTKWSNVEKAIEDLKIRGLLEPVSLVDVDISLLEELVRCCGFYRQKASRLKNLACFFMQNDMETLFSIPVNELRETLLSIRGVGNETADCIILYAAGRPKFVIDAYTTRIMKCMGTKGSYMQLQQLFEDNLPADVDLYKEYHALIVEYSKAFCSKKRCEDCLLREKIRR